MNRARIAELLLEQARICTELAAEFSDAEGGVVLPPAPKSKTRARKQREIVRPAGEGSASVAGRAARILRERGFR